jgi:excisionase family DNA binding protein
MWPLPENSGKPKNWATGRSMLYAEGCLTGTARIEGSMMDRYLTTGQVAQELKTSTQTVRNYCDSGVIKATKSAGGHYRIEPNR